MAQEEAKHLKRATRLKRIETLAKDAGDDKALARAGKLIEREQKRYDSKMQRLTERMNKVGQLGKGESERGAERSDKAKAKKPKDRGDKDNDDDKDDDKDDD